MRESRANNKGFSLLELLVSITILAIIVIPVMHSFVTAKLTNTKAKRVMEATSAAQNLVEEIKSTSKTPQEAGFTACDASGNEIPLSALDSTPIEMWKKSCTSDVNNKTFYAEMTMTPRAPVTMAEVSSMSDATSAACTVTSSMDVRAAYDFELEEPESDRSGLSRDIQITLSTEAGSGAAIVKSQITYHYDGEDKTMYDVPYTIYKGTKLEDIYIFFDPMEYGGETERVFVDNPEGVPVNVYLVRQGSSTMNAVSLNITEAKHTDSTAATRVLTNMTTDLTSGQLTVQYTDGCVDHWYDAGSSLTAVGLKEDNASMSNPEWLMTTDNTMIYDIEVKVYDKKPSAGGKLLATLTGTKTE